MNTKHTVEVILAGVVVIGLIFAAYFYGIHKQSYPKPKTIIEHIQNKRQQNSIPSKKTEAAPTNSRSQTGLANPASTYCVEKGGTVSIETMGNGGEYGLCNFDDDQACEEWAMYRGQCPVGGIKTIGYDNIQQSYCAWIGGTTEAVSNASCTLPNGNVCSVDALYNGTCN